MIHKNEELITTLIYSLEKRGLPNTVGIIVHLAIKKEFIKDDPLDVHNLIKVYIEHPKVKAIKTINKSALTWGPKTIKNYCEKREINAFFHSNKKVYKSLDAYIQGYEKIVKSKLTEIYTIRKFKLGKTQQEHELYCIPKTLGENWKTSKIYDLNKLPHIYKATHFQDKPILVQVSSTPLHYQAIKFWNTLVERGKSPVIEVFNNKKLIYEPYDWSIFTRYCKITGLRVQKKVYSFSPYEYKFLWDKDLETTNTEFQIDIATYNILSEKNKKQFEDYVYINRNKLIDIITTKLDELLEQQDDVALEVLGRSDEDRELAIYNLLVAKLNKELERLADLDYPCDVEC